MRNTLILLCLAASIVVACSREPVPVADLKSVPERQEASSLIPGSVIIQLDEPAAEDLAASGFLTKAGDPGTMFDGLGVTSVERLYPDAGEWEPRHREAGLHRWYRITYDPARLPATKAADGFSALPGVVYAEPERRIRSTAFFDDPMASQQWHLYNDGSLGAAYLEGCDLNVQPVWSNFTAGSPEVIVAVIDGGVQMDHPDLAAACVPVGENGSRSFVNGDSGYFIQGDDHGTHVAGIIGAVNNNGVGVSGIAGGSDGKGGVKILSCAIFKDDPNNPENTIQGDTRNAMIWAADHGAVIANNSWGYVYDSETEAAEGDVGSMGPAIDYFIKYAGCDKDGNQRADSPMKGGVVIFAAGNESWQAGWPAAYEPVIAVGAVNSKFTRPYYSNFGDWVDICAPGGDAKTGVSVLSTIADGKYAGMQGTSMACPMVSGVAALIVSHFGGPGFTNEMLKERLLGGANSTKVESYLMIGPLADALGAFTYKGTLSPKAAENVSVSAHSNNIDMSWKVTSDPDDGKAYGYLALAAEDASALEGLDPRRIPASVRQANVEVGSLAVGDEISASLSDLSFSTTYYTTVIAYDYSGNYSEPSEIKQVRTEANLPPVISTEYVGDFRVKPFAVLSVQYVVSDPDGHSFTVEVDPGSTALEHSKREDVVTIKITGSKAPAGKYTAHIVAKDKYGASTDLAVQYEILENHAPKVVSEISNLQFGTVGESLTLDMAKYFQDEDKEPLTYTVTMTEQNVAHLNPSGNNLVLTTLGYGLTTATVTVTDACKASCSTTFMVLVRDESRQVDLYPNPVVNTLNIRPGQDGQVDVRITNRVGATVWSGTSAAGPFAPLAVDLSGQPGGVYYVRIEGAGINDVFTVVKQ